MRIFIIALLAISAVTTAARAQSLTTGAIQGVVKNEMTGEALVGATVTATSGASAPQTAYTDVDGSYKITELPPGTYTVTFTYDGDPPNPPSKLERRNIDVGIDRVTNVFAKLRSGETIVVKARPIQIHTDSTAHRKTMGRKELESLPFPGPTFESAIGSIGGATNDGHGVAFSSATSLENRYIVDGIDITGLTFGDVGTPVLNDFIEELEVVTGGYNAEYGRATGGIVNLVTRSGTDTLRGSVFGVLTPGFLTAASQRAPINASSIDVTAHRAYAGHIGFELGGPIKKGLAWFYVGVAPQVTRTDYTRTTKRETDCKKVLDNGQMSTCETQYADSVPDIDPKTGFFLTDDLDSETRTGTTKTYSLVGKLTFAPTARDRAQVSVIAMPSTTDAPGLYGLPTTAVHSSSLTTDTAARWTSKFADGKTEIEALAAWHRSTLESGALDPALDDEPRQLLYGRDLGTWSKLGGESDATIRGCTDGGTGDPYKLITNCPMSNSAYAIGGPGPLAHDKEERRAARLSLIERIRHHEIKAGLDYEDNTKEAARLLSGGRAIQNFVTSQVIVDRWVQLAAPGDMDPRFDQTCTTPDSGGGVGSTSRPFRCAYLTGHAGDPGTLVGGQTVDWAAYLRDSWQLRSNLTLNVGLRYEEQIMRYAEHLRGTTDPLTGNHLGSTAMTLHGNFAPRLGVIYDPSGQGRSKIYAHWGRFYESVPMDINDRSFGGEVNLRQTFDSKQCGAVDPAIGGTDGKNCAGSSQEQLIGSSGVLVAPGIKAEYVDEVMAGAELAIIPDTVLGLHVQHRRLGRAIEDVSTDGANTYIIANPGEWSDDDEQALEQRIAATTDKTLRSRLEHELQLFRGIRGFDKPVRDYDAVEVSLGRKLPGGLYLEGSYTYSRTEGNYPGSLSYDNGQIDPNISSQYDLIELLANRRGRLPQDRPHSVKLDAYRGFKVRGGILTLGSRIRAVSGIPTNALAGHPVYGPDESFLLPRGVLGRTAFEHGIDVHVAYRKRLSATTSAELYVDVFNLYNNQGTFDVDNTYAPYYRLSSAGNPSVQENAYPISGGTYDDLIWAKTVDSRGVETAQPIGRNPNFHHTTSRYAPASAQVGFRVTF